MLRRRAWLLGVLSVAMLGVPVTGAAAYSDPAAGEQGAAPLSAVTVGGQPDPLSSLGVVSPLCAALADGNPSNDPRLTSDQRRRCARSGSVESDYPASNFAFDINIDTSITKPKNVAANTLQTLLQGAWLAWVYFTRGVFALLQWAFSLSPFTDSATMAVLDAKLEAMRRALTAPLLPAAFGLIGVGLVWRAFARREGTAALGGALASCVMMLLAAWIIAAPKQTVGRAASITNDVAKAAIAAPQGKPPAKADESFAAVLGRAWTDLVEEPWCALEFGDVAWCLSAPEPAAVRAAEAGAAGDLTALGVARETQGRLLSSLLAPGNSAALQDAIAAAVRERYGPARTRAELYWRYSPESAPRNALYYAYSGKERRDAPLPGVIKSALNAASPIGAAGDTADEVAGWLGISGGGGGPGLARDKVAIQAEGGTWTRMGLVPIVLFALTGAALLLGWLAVRLFLQAAVALVLVLAAPVVLLFAAAGASGRRAFAVWAQSLTGAVIGKAFYAALLGVTLAGASLIGSLTERRAWGLTFILMGLFYWAVFLKRSVIAGWLAPPLEHDRSQAGGGMRLLAGGYYGWMLGRQAAGVVRTAGRRVAGVAAATGARREASREIVERAAGDVAADRVRGRMSEVLDRRVGGAERRLDERSRTERELRHVEDELRAIEAERVGLAAGAAAAGWSHAATRAPEAGDAGGASNPRDATGAGELRSVSARAQQTDRRPHRANDGAAGGGPDDAARPSAPGRRAALEGRARELVERREQLRARLAGTEARAQADRRLVAERDGGDGWSDERLLGEAQRVRRRLALPADSAESLRHYAGVEAAEYRAMPREQRERVVREVEGRRERERLEVDPDGALAALPKAPGDRRTRAGERAYAAGPGRRDAATRALIERRAQEHRRDVRQEWRRTRRPTRG